MAMIQCVECGSQISDRARSCPQCGFPLIDQERDSSEVVKTVDRDYTVIATEVKAKGIANIKDGFKKPLGWFLMVNGGVILSLTVFLGTETIEMVPYILILGSIFPLISLVLSTTNAKRAHTMTVIREGNFENKSEQSLYYLVQCLSERAGLEKVPEVAIYESDDYNAFTTGMSRKHALVAFSTGLLRKIDEQGLAAVAAHKLPTLLMEIC